jgi:glycosyltransferase involved in cell wall biosynthesis
MRRVILGYDRYRKIVRSVPCRIVGENPGLPDAFTASDWEALKENYRNHRAYVYTALSEYEDGYNLAMLEAMATGMPVVSIENDTSPIIDGVNGFISDDERVLEKRLKQLLLDREKAAAMGTAARQTVSNLFGIHRFIQNWRRLIAGIIPNQEVTYEGELAIQRT